MHFLTICFTFDDEIRSPDSCEDHRGTAILINEARCGAARQFGDLERFSGMEDQRCSSAVGVGKGWHVGGAFNGGVFRPRPQGAAT